MEKAGAVWRARVAPTLFVLLWSSGFIGGKLGVPHADPFAFLLLRMAAATAILGVWAVLARAPWPRAPAMIGHLCVAGLLVQGTYLAGVFAALAQGMGAGLVALIVGLQPLATAAVAGPMLGERVRPRQWAGLALGLAGVMLVVWRDLTLGGGAAAVVLAVLALVGITLGTLYQKRFCTAMDLRSGTAIQFAAACAMMAVLTGTVGQFRVDWTGSFVFALVWLVLVLSVGALLLLYTLIRDGQAARVASLFYLTPPVTAVMAWALFGEALSMTALAGFVVAAVGVVVARRG
jgi:drug/metabolite transporter (DMT)-like permease